MAFADLSGGMKPDDEVDFFTQQDRQELVTAVQAVRQQHLSCLEMAHQFACQSQFVSLPDVVREGDQTAGVKAEQRDKFSNRKAAAFLLSTRVGIPAAIVLGIRH